MNRNRWRTILLCMGFALEHFIIHQSLATSHDLARYCGMSPQGIRQAMEVAIRLEYMEREAIRFMPDGRIVWGYYPNREALRRLDTEIRNQKLIRRNKIMEQFKS